MLEAAEVLEVPELMHCVVLCMLGAVEGGLYLLEVLKMMKVMRRLLFCMLEAVEGELVYWKCWR